MALTWQSVSPSNPAGILQASNMAGANIAKGLDILGSSMQEGAKNKQDAETGKLLLMLDNAKSRNERQNILDNADKSYIDQDVIAKDNQEFEVREQQKEVQAFNRTMQEQGAAREIARDKASTAFQQWKREDSAKKDALQAKNRAADVLARDAQNERMYQARVDAEKNKEAERKRLATLRALQEKRALIRDEQERKKNEIEIKELEREQANAVKGEALVGNHQDKLTKASASVPDLVTYWTELDTAETGGVKAASDLKKQVATQLYREIDRFDVFGEGIKISDKLQSVTGGTIEENKKAHRANVKVFSDSLRNILPGIINEEQLKSMSERMLNNVQMTEENTYGDAALNLNKSIERVRDDKANEFSRMLFDRKQSDGGISADEYTFLDTYIKNPGNFNTDTDAIRNNLSSMLKTEVGRQYNKTELINPNNAGYIDVLRKGAAIGQGLFSKNKNKTNHKELVTRLTTAEFERANAFGITKKEVRAKIEEQLNNVPGYQTILEEATGISWEQQQKNDEAENKILGSRMASSAKSSKEINTAIKHHKDNMLPVPENLTNKLNTAVKNNVLKIIDKSKLSTEGGVEVVEGKKVFNYDEYNAWQIKVRDAIRKEYPDVPDATLESEIGNIVGNNPFLRKSIDMHNRTVAQIEKLAKLTDELDAERQKLLKQKTYRWQDNAVQYISDYISTSTGMKDILKRLGEGGDSTEKDDFIKTVKNIQITSNKIYNELKSIYPKYDDRQLLQAAERTASRLEVESPSWHGNKAWFSLPSDDEILRAAKGEGSGSGNKTTGNILELEQAIQQKIDLERQLEWAPLNSLERRQKQADLAAVKEKILSARR